MLPRQKLVLSLDSHALSSFPRCPKEHELAYVEHLEPIKIQSYYEKGTLIHLMLALYYKLRRRGFSVDKSVMLVTTKRFKRYSKLFDLSTEEQMTLLSRFFEYVSHYKNEMVKTVGIETGFSEKIYEDKNFLFIYEGRVDFIGFSIVENAGKILHFTDHKTRNQSYELDCFRNQFFGYAWMLRKVYGKDYQGWGCVNYFGLQEDKTKKIMKEGKLFERVWFNFTNAQIDQWEKDTITWFHRIAQARMFKIFPRSWNCERKFGECDFKRICKQPTNETKNLIKFDGIYYKKREKAWSAWEN